MASRSARDVIHRDRRFAACPAVDTDVQSENSPRLHVLHRHHAGNGLDGASDLGAHLKTAGEFDFHFAVFAIQHDDERHLALAARGKPGRKRAR